MEQNRTLFRHEWDDGVCFVEWTSCWTIKESCFDSWHGRRFVYGVNRSYQLDFTHLPIQCLPGTLLPGLKQPECDASGSTNAKNEFRHTGVFP